jgi:UDP-3-O-[3-hydroxymyristoyl] glucosamine N-acyltransferase
VRPLENTPRNFGAIHPTALIGGDPQHFKDRYLKGDHTVTIGEGVKIGPYTSVDRGIERPTSVDDFTYIMGRCNIGHDAQVGKRCEIADGAIVGGHCDVGDDVRIGLNATILPYKKVGDGARIGAGAVVTKDVPAGETWAGVPARPISSNTKQGEVGNKKARRVAESRA